MDKNYEIYLQKKLIPFEEKEKEYKGQIYFHQFELAKYKRELVRLEEEVELREEKEFTEEEEKELKRIKKKISYHTNRAEEFIKKKEHIHAKLLSYKNHEHKSEILDEIENHLQKIKQKVIDKKDRMLKKKDAKKQKQKKMTELRQKWKHESRQRYFKYKEMDRSYRHFIKASNQFPDYLQKKLKKMPENKGYIWKGIWFFGLKPTQDQNSLRMFERTYDKQLLVHEYDNNRYRVYRKDQKRRREILIYEKEKRKKTTGLFNLKDYVTT